MQVKCFSWITRRAVDIIIIIIMYMVGHIGGGQATMAASAALMDADRHKIMQHLFCFGAFSFAISFNIDFFCVHKQE